MTALSAAAFPTGRFAPSSATNSPGVRRDPPPPCCNVCAGWTSPASRADSPDFSARSHLVMAKARTLRRRALRLSQDEAHPLFVFSLTGEELLRVAEISR